MDLECHCSKILLYVHYRFTIGLVAVDFSTFYITTHYEVGVYIKKFEFCITSITGWVGGFKVV